MLVLMIDLRQAGGHFAGARAGCSDDNQRTACLDEFVAAIAFIADDAGNFAWIAGDDVVQIGRNAQLCKPDAELIRSRLMVVFCDADGADIEADLTEGVDKTEGIHIIGDSQVAPDFALFHILCIDDDDNFRLVLQLQKHLQFGVRFKARQDAGCMIIIEKFAAEFQIEFAAELGNPLTDPFRLRSEILIIIKTDFHMFPPIGC